MVVQSLTSVDAVEGEQMSVGVKFCSLFHSNPTLDMTLVTTTSTRTMIMVTLNTNLIVSKIVSPERSSLPWSMVAAMVLTPVLIIFLTIIIKNVNQSTEREEGRGKYWILSYSIETSDCNSFCDHHPINTETLRHRSQVQFPFSNMMFFQSNSECFQFITRLTNHLLS